MDSLIRLITENPHRIVGIYANASAKEILANKSKTLAYSKVGKEIVFPTDLTCILPPLIRDMDRFNEACSKISVPEDRLKYAQFWFLQTDEVDILAMEQLALGDMDSALRLWGQQETASSLQNQMLCYILQQDLPTAIATAESLYGQYAETYLSIIGLSDSVQITAEALSLRFVETLSQKTDSRSVFDCCQSSAWREDLKSRIVQSTSDELMREIDRFRNADQTDPQSLKEAGENLMTQSKSLLKSLREMISKDDLQYQMLADKVGMAVLDCCVEYINTSPDDAYDKIHEMYGLIIYVKNTIVGEAAKHRFDENYEVIQPILQISRGDYERAVSAPRRRRIKWLVYLGIIVFTGALAVYLNSDFHSFWEGVCGSVPICYIASRIMRVLDE